jgi:dethiobiotin synthetase/adenosylmethionine--8-amino-7-oxononanoate aminotransferase
MLYNYFPTRNFQIYQIFASNTNLGKTIISAGLIRSSILKSNYNDNNNNNNNNNNNSNNNNINNNNNSNYKNYKTYYLKSIQTGYPKDSDSRFVKTFIPEDFKNNNSNNHDHDHDDFVKIKTLYKYERPVSPHLAVDNPIPNDAVVLNKIKSYISDCYNESINSGGKLFLETAGGIVYIHTYAYLLINFFFINLIPFYFVGVSSPIMSGNSIF